MRKSRQLIVSAMVIALLLGGTVSHAAMLTKGMKGSEGQLLSEVTTYAGSGLYEENDGSLKEASFRSPQGVAVLKDGSLIVSDNRNHVIRRIAEGEVSTYAGLTLTTDAFGQPEGGWNDGPAATAMFNEPAGLSVDGKGNIYVADAANNMIRKIDSNGQVSTVAGHIVLGYRDGVGEEARFDHPLDVAAAADGTLYVADTLNHVIRKIDVNGRVTTLNAPSERVVEIFPGVVEFAGDYVDGPLATAKFNEPSGIAIDSKGNLYVSDSGNRLIRYIDLAAGTVSTVAGVVHAGSQYEAGALYAASGYVDGPADEAQFFAPQGIAVTAEDGLLIADRLNHVIRYVIDGQVMTVAGHLIGEYGSEDGINGHNLLNGPSDVAVMNDGSFVIADTYNNVIRRYELYRLPTELPTDQRVKVVLNDEVIIFDAQPEITADRVMVPVRALAEKLDYEVSYKGSGTNQSVFLAKDGKTLELTIGEKVMIIEDETEGTVRQEIDVAPYIKEDRTYVPIRFFSEQFGLDVEWIHKYRTVLMRQIR